MAACGLAALLHAVVAAVGEPDPVRVPTAPPVVPVVAGLGAALLVAAGAGLPFRVRAGAGALCGAGLLAGSLLAVPHTALIAAVWLGSRVTGGTGPFAVAPVWPVTAAHLVTAAAALLLGAWLVRQRRRHRGRCGACGRVDPAPGPVRGPGLPLLAALAVAGALPYGLLKAAWALGWTGGLTGDAFAGVSFTSPGFGDTAVLTAISVVVAIAMGARASGRWLRPLLTAVGVLGSGMLLPVAVMAALALVPVALGLAPIDESEIAAWAFLVVYGSFLVWGAALAALTAGYWRATRGECRRHDAVAGPR